MVHSVTVKLMGRKWSLANPYRNRAGEIVRRIKNLSSSVLIDFDWCTIDNIEALLHKQMHCQCCGRILHQKLGRGQHANSPSLDRLIPALGYVESNCFLICSRCNTLKRDASLLEIEAIYKYIQLHTKK